MPQDKYVPKHRSAPTNRVRKSASNVVKLSGVAVWATGVTVVGGVVANGGQAVAETTLDDLGLSAATRLGGLDLAARGQRISRSTDRLEKAAAETKSLALADDKGVAVANSEDLTVADPRTLARALMGKYGLSSSEFGCLDNIWSQESGWNVHADNPTSSAYGIPQALPGSKMSSAGPDWEHNAETQIRWGLGYIKARYGTACSAWSFKQGHGWY